MWITICFFGVLIIGGVVSCITGNVEAFKEATVLDFLIGIGYFIRELFYE